MRKLLLSLLVLILSALFLSPALAATETAVHQNVDTGFEAVIVDPAGLLDRNGITEVLESMIPVTDYANVGFLTYAANGSDATSVVEKAKKWGNSRFGYESPYTVFMIDMKTRRLGIWSSESADDLMTTAKANTVTDNVYRYASREDYAGCAKEAFREIAQVMSGNRISEHMKYISNIFLALICAILVTYMLVTGRMRNEQATTIQTLTQAAGVGAATAVTGHVLKKVVHHQSSSGGGGRGFGGGGGGGFGGGGSGGSHGF